MKIKKEDYIILIIISIFIVSFIEIKIFSLKSEPILMNYAVNSVNNIISNMINDSVNNIKYNYRYNDIILIEKDKNDNISSVSFNNEKVNDILFKVTEELLNKIKLLEETKYEQTNLNYLIEKNEIYFVPYGIIYENSILSNLGPKIPFKTILIGNTSNNTKINIEEYGINSSKVEVVLNIDLKMKVILPFKSDDIIVNKSIILDSKIIQGKVPNYYGGLFSAN